MTLQELCEELDISVPYAKSQWANIRANRAKQGLYLYKIGRGDKAQYGVRKHGEEKVRWEALNEND